MENPIWEVDLYVEGPIAVRGRVQMTQQKGFRVDDPFYTDVQLSSFPSGLKATILARAADQDSAREAAIHFFGQMLDALTLAIDRPLSLSYSDDQRRGAPRQDVRRVVERDEFETAFREAHRLRAQSPSFLRSVSWYRKGLATEDPMDRFLAHWNAIEIVAQRYARYVPAVDQKRAAKGSKSRIWECFKALWGPCDNWPVVPNRCDWIDECHKTRNDVAHGRVPVAIDQVVRIADQVAELKPVSHQFLRDWRERFLDLPRNAPSESLPPSDVEMHPE